MDHQEQPSAGSGNSQLADIADGPAPWGLQEHSQHPWIHLNSESQHTDDSSLAEYRYADSWWNGSWDVDWGWGWHGTCWDGWVPNGDGSLGADSSVASCRTDSQSQTWGLESWDAGNWQGASPPAFSSERRHGIACERGAGIGVALHGERAAAARNL